MPAEIKSKGVKVETTVSRTLRDRFKRHCKKMNVSVSQHLRDLMQVALKAK
ncbi:MAG: hypothetical protein ACTHMM_05605 [Agriterribacter sp.]